MFPKKAIKMQKIFKMEDSRGYLTQEESRSPFLTTFNKGKLFNAMNEQIKKEILLYVLDENDRLFSVPTSYGWNHSFFLAGGPVHAAGMIRVDNEGDIDLISNESGHYIPTTKDMLHALAYFSDQLEDSSNREFIVYEGHDNARAGILKRYKLEDLLTIELDDEYSVEEQLEELCIETISSKAEEQYLPGYGSASPQNSPKIISRYGLKPNISGKENSQSMINIGFFGHKTLEGQKPSLAMGFKISS